MLIVFISSQNIYPAADSSTFSTASTCAITSTWCLRQVDGPQPTGWKSPVAGRRSSPYLSVAPLLVAPLAYCVGSQGLFAGPSACHLAAPTNRRTPLLSTHTLWCKLAAGARLSKTSNSTARVLNCSPAGAGTTRLEARLKWSLLATYAWRDAEAVESFFSGGPPSQFRASRRRAAFDPVGSLSSDQRPRTERGTAPIRTERPHSLPYPRRRSVARRRQPRAARSQGC